MSAIDRIRGFMGLAGQAQELQDAASLGPLRQQLMQGQVGEMQTLNPLRQKLMEAQVQEAPIQLQMLRGQAEDQTAMRPFKQKLMQTQANSEVQEAPLRLRALQQQVTSQPELQKGRLLSDQLHGGADFAQAAMMAGFDPEQLRMILSQKLGLGDYNPEQATQDYMRRTKPNLFKVFNSQAQ